MKRGQIPDEKVPIGERLKIVVDRHVHLDMNTPSHPNNVRAQMMRKNEIACLAIFSEAWGG